MSAITVTKHNFKTEVETAPQTVLLDFWAPWCGPCRMLSPVVEELAAEMGDQVRVCKINVDNDPELAQQFSVMSIPTMVVMKDGKAVTSAVGVRPKKAIKEMLERN